MSGDMDDEDAGDPGWTPEKERRSDPAEIMARAEKLLKMGEASMAGGLPPARAMLPISVNIRWISNGFVLSYMELNGDFPLHVEKFITLDAAGLGSVGEAMSAMAKLMTK